MAFVSNEIMKEKRAAIKKAFPVKDGWKFSVRKIHHSEISITLTQYPDNYDFYCNDEDYIPVNHYCVENSMKRYGLGEREIAVFQKIKEIAFDGHWDKSDIMTDYFNCAWYISLSIGTWDKPASKLIKSVPSAA